MTDIDIGVAGMSKLSDKYFILYEESNKIDIFEAGRPYRRASTVTIDGANPGDLRDIAACEVSRCVYVTDCGQMCIWRFDSNSENIASKFTTLNGIPRALSVTSNGRLLVIERKHNRVYILNKEGKVERFLEMPEDMHYIHHAVETSRDTLLVCHGNVDFRLHRVCELSITGKDVIKSFGDKCDHGPANLSCPVYFTVNNNDQSVFVADSGNRRIQVLDKQLILTLSLSTEAFNPTSLCYDAERQLLLVGSKSEGLKMIHL